MKKTKYKIQILMFLFVAGLTLFNACKEEEVYPRVRLFQPVLNEDLYAVENTIVVDLGKLKEAEYYIVEVSRDSFLTTSYTVETDTNFVVIDETLIGEELLWRTLYQVQVTAIADEVDYNSKPSFLGSVRTEKFPSNLLPPGEFDMLDTRGKVIWTTVGEAITGIRVFAEDDERLETSLLEFEVTEEEQLAELVVVSGLQASTTYQIAIYSGDKLRGWENYTTKEALVSGDNVYDLTGILTDSTNILADTLADVVDGAVLLLEGGKIYKTGGYMFDKSVTIRSGYSFTQALPEIDCSANFNIADGANISLISFKDIYFKGDFGGNYVLNIDQSGTIGEIKFETCKIHSLRGIARMKGGAGTLEKYTISDCVVDSINGYGVMYVDIDTWSAGDVLIENSTFSKVVYFLASRSNTNAITIDGCTFNEVPEAGRQMFRWRGDAGNNDILNGLKIYNSIWGAGWDMDADGSVGVKGSQGLANTTVDVKSTYSTFDFAFSSDPLPGFPSFVYSGTAADLWVDPFVTVDFNFLDTGFDGKGNTGDPRWRIGL